MSAQPPTPLPDVIAEASAAITERAAHGAARTVVEQRTAARREAPPGTRRAMSFDEAVAAERAGQRLREQITNARGATVDRLVSIKRRHLARAMDAAGVPITGRQKRKFRQAMRRAERASGSPREGRDDA